MKIPRKIFSELVEIILEGGAIKVTKYYDEKTIVRATRKLYNGKIDKRGNAEILFTIGEPNYKETEFIKKCKKANEPFPIKKTQIKFLEE